MLIRVRFLAPVPTFDGIGHLSLRQVQWLGAALGVGVRTFPSWFASLISVTFVGSGSGEGLFGFGSTVGLEVKAN